MTHIDTSRKGIAPTLREHARFMRSTCLCAEQDADQEGKCWSCEVADQLLAAAALVEERDAIERAVREVAPIENSEGSSFQYVVLGEDGDPLVQSDAIAEVVAMVVACWDKCAKRLTSAENSLEEIMSVVSHPDAPDSANTPQVDLVSRWYVTLAQTVLSENDRHLDTITGTPDPTDG